ncbi:MAG: hypothetical protein SAL07_06850 [Oscillatoria sp. PMC 1051.18]|nr:hypothetical protein [Oscillatoria sp. PMC 1050.18]MEC5029615.1 hypothetical protein [Oscillatoria sp. PMC 1051.18]
MEQYSKLYLTRPEQLPRHREEISQNCSLEVQSAIADCTYKLRSSNDADALRHIRETFNWILLNFPSVVARHQTVTKSVERNEKDYYVEIVDNYMGVVRVDGDPFFVLLQSILQAYSELLEEALSVGTSIKAPKWRNLRHAFESILSYLAQESIPPSADPCLTISPRSNPADNNDNPLRRWVIGHHVFYVLIQSLIVALNCFHAEMKAENFQEAEVAIAIATSLMWGAESALRFTGDFSSSQFQDVVRPSMMPPNAPSGLSGQFSMDHLYLVKLLSKLKPMLANLNHSLMTQHQQFTKAFEATYEAHKFVCGKFVGINSQSLRMNSSSKKSAVDVLNDLKILRLKNLKN